MQEYDLFIPLFYNDGTPIESTTFQDLQARLLDEFGGLTFFPQPNQGFWRMGNVTYRDEIVIYRVIAPRPRAARRLSDTTQRGIEEESSASGRSHCGADGRDALASPAA